VVQLVVGRTEEVGALGGLLADPFAQPRALLIEGEPGIGKTTLLQQLIVNAEEREHAVLSCRPTRSEMDLSYVGLVELLAAVDDGVVVALPAPQARVLRMILRREEPDGAFDRLSLGVAMVAGVRAIAATRPVLSRSTMLSGTTIRARHARVRAAATLGGECSDRRRANLGADRTRVRPAGDHG
jgi:hypothetical protein